MPERALPPEADLRRWPPDEDDDLYPEKQHIVPFTIARQVVDKGGTRATASPANAIGNLTWLSRRQNSLDSLADRWTVMDRDRDGTNLAARGMTAAAANEASSRQVLGVYEALRDLVLDKRWREEKAEAQRLFATLCDGRAAWMVGQMREWLEEPLPPDAARWLAD